MQTTFANQYNTTTATQTTLETFTTRDSLSMVQFCEAPQANTQRWQILLGVDAPDAAGLITQSFPPARWNPARTDIGPSETTREFRRFDSSQEAVTGHHLHWTCLVESNSQSVRSLAIQLGGTSGILPTGIEALATQVITHSQFLQEEIRQIELRKLARRNPTVILPPARTTSGKSQQVETAQSDTSSSNHVDGSIFDREIRQRYENLLVETAHDLRAPISTARQLINTVAHRAKNHGSITAQEVSLLEVANRRLAQASQWASSILVSNRLIVDATQTIRQRFYPQQWQSLMRPLLQAIASDYDIRLLWVGWDRSLPQLYLDVNQLSRVVLNLVTNAIQASEAGSQISIRTSWEKSQSPRLVIHVEDQGQGLSQALLRELNASHTNVPATLDTPGRRRGIGLDTVKRLVPALGASLSAQNRVTAGAEIRLTLPVDDPRALFRNWLTTLTDRTQIANQTRELRCSIFGLRWLDAVARNADKQIQQFASPRDFVYRTADDRWLLLTVADADAVQSSLNDFAAELSETLGLDALRAGLLGQTKPFTLGSLQRPTDANKLSLPDLVQQLSGIAEDAMRNSVPRIDDLEETFSGLYSEAVKQCLSGPSRGTQKTPARQTVENGLRQKQNGSRPAASINQKTQSNVGSVQHRIDSPEPTQQNTASDSRTHSEQTLSEAIEHLSTGWKHRQSRLQRFRDTKPANGGSGVS